MLKLADRVKQAHAAGYTQTQLAKAAGVSSSAAAQWASGNTKSLSGEAAAGLSRSSVDPLPASRSLMPAVRAFAHILP